MPASVNPSRNTAEAKEAFLAGLEASRERHYIRNQTLDSQATRAWNTFNKVSPSKCLVDENWAEWDEGQILMLETLTGEHQLPLSYAIKAEEHPDGIVSDNSVEECIEEARLDEAAYDHFVDECIARTRIEVPQCVTDDTIVTQLLQLLPDNKSSRKVQSLEKTLLKKRAAQSDKETLVSDSNTEDENLPEDESPRKQASLEQFLKRRAKDLSLAQDLERSATQSDEETSDSDSGTEEDNASSAFRGRTENQRAKKRQKMSKIYI